ncbi:MAG: response regulator transcription factor [Bacteroidales bacterium]|nr:response regulator transcription factor [Candidatus Colimorpha onthohippi]
MKSRILVVDDEQDLCEILQFNLEAEGYEVQTVNSGEAALDLLLSQSFSLVLLDVMLDRLSGYDVARRLRLMGNTTPIIFLTALGDEGHQLEGFDAGADDYISKPFSYATVSVRVQAVLRRSESQSTETCLIEYGIKLNVACQTAFIADIEVQLTKKEWALLMFLIRNKGHYFSREAIMRQVWEDGVYVSERTVDVQVARLRKKLGSEGSHIVNRTGLGYAFV